MAFVEDCVDELSRRIKQLSGKTLSYCVRVDDDGLRAVYSELNGESCLGRDWKALAGKLLKPRPTCATIENLSQSGNAARELLKTWVSQQCDQNQTKTFEMLIETMLKCKLYSACDELLDFLEKFEDEPDAIDNRPEVVGDVDEICEEKCTTLSVLQRPDNAFDEILSCDVPDPVVDKSSRPQENNCTTIVVLDDQQQDQRQQRQPFPALDDQQQQVVDTGFRQRPNRRQPPARSISCPASFGGLIWKKIRRLFRSRSDPGRNDPSPTPIIQELVLSVPQDEIFVVSSDPDYKTKTMQDLLSFIYRMEPVTRRMLTVRTIHDVDQNGLVTTTWLEERVNRAKFVILCFSSIMKAITEAKSIVPGHNHQIDHNIKFTMDFLVTGRIYESLCKNPNGKFVPVVLHGHGINTIIVPLRFFQSFSWPEEKTKFSNYIMELPERAVPRVGTPKPLVRKEFSA